MADESLIWTDVRFDHAAAEDAAAACDQAARRLREAAGQRRAEAHQALDATSGPWRDRLVSEVDRVEAQSTAIEARLRALADALRTASADARADQLRREEARPQRSDARHPSVR